jgi:hypothetical protein
MKESIKILRDKKTKDEFKAIKKIFDLSNKTAESKLDFSGYTSKLTQETQEYVEKLKEPAIRSLKIWSDKLSIEYGTLLNFVYDYEYELSALEQRFN